MLRAPTETSPSPTLLLLIEADLSARSRHEKALQAAGYVVLACGACPDEDELHLAAVVLSDIASFHWLQEQNARRLPPTIVVTDDEKAGVTACLCGAAAWVPTYSDDAYLVDTLDGLLPQRHPVTRPT
jgi:hypothetical protein